MEDASPLRQLRAVCTQVGSGDPDRVRLPADALSAPVEALLEAFAAAEREDMLLAYQLARAMDLAGHHLQAHSALKTLAGRPDARTEWLSVRLRFLHEELTWAGVISEPLPEGAEPLPEDAPAADDWLGDMPRSAPQVEIGPLTDAYLKLRDPNRLWDAWRTVRGKRGGPGADGVTIAQFEASIVTQFQSIGRELREEAYSFGPPVTYDVPKPGGGKRKLRVPCVRDRVLLCAASHVLAEHYEALFAPHSYAYRPGRSVQMALGAVRALMGIGRNWVGDADISACFDSVDHGKLMGVVEQQVRDKQFTDFLRSALVALADPETPGKGIPQGSPLSPVLCNIYLDPLDHAAQSQGLVIVRYADDFVVLAVSEDEVRAALDWCGNYLIDELGLEVNAGKTHIVAPGEQLKFLGDTIA